MAKWTDNPRDLPWANSPDKPWGLSTVFPTSYIRKEKYNPATTPMYVCMYVCHAQATLPWILKRGGLESSGRRLISSIGNTKRVAFFFWQKKYFQNFQIFWKKSDFLRFFQIFEFLTIFGFFGFFNGFLDFFEIFWIFLGFFFDFRLCFFLGFFLLFWIFLFNFLDFFLDNFGFLGFLSKLLRLLLKVTNVTTGHQKLPKMGQNSIINPFFAPRAKKASAKGRSP